VHIFVTPTDPGRRSRRRPKPTQHSVLLLEPPIGCLWIGQNCHIRRHMTGNELPRRLRRLGSERGVEVHGPTTLPHTGAAERAAARRGREQGATLRELADSYDRSISTMRRATKAA
jgi:hypothetical protein